ncbi:MAG: SpoIIE family protein phosphatase [Dehalococcoidia bacterium]|nr:SpoIIE family protein phosphatase [Dehalococcoidia bacterium]
MTYKILVVDDEPDLEPLVLQRMRRQIRRGRYEFVFAHNGIEALEQLQADPGIDMVVSDINMPRMDGLTLLEQIPNVSPDIRAIIVSAYGDMENIRTAMNRGAFDFVTKPVDFDDLQFTIDRTLEHIEQWREALSTRDKLVALQNELDVASKMQQSILPTAFPTGPSYKTFGTMQPARNVGGDFFDVIRLEDDKVGLAIADVSDKGVPAALFMMSSRTLLKGSAIGMVEGPGAVLTEVNNLLSEDDTTGMFVTMLYAVYDPATGVLTYASGGHDPPLVVHADGTSELQPLTGGIALGVLGGFEFSQESFELQPGDTVCFYTDGVTEATNEQGVLMGIEGVQDLFASAPPVDAEQAGMAMMDRGRAFTGEAPQFDDIPCLTLRRD